MVNDYDGNNTMDVWCIRGETKSKIVIMMGTKAIGYIVGERESQLG